MIVLGVKDRSVSDDPCFGSKGTKETTDTDGRWNLDRFLGLSFVVHVEVSSQEYFSSRGKGEGGSKDDRPFRPYYRSRVWRCILLRYLTPVTSGPISPEPGRDRVARREKTNSEPRVVLCSGIRGIVVGGTEGKGVSFRTESASIKRSGTTRKDLVKGHLVKVCSGGTHLKTFGLYF